MLDRVHNIYTLYILVHCIILIQLTGKGNKEDRRQGDRTGDIGKGYTYKIHAKSIPRLVSYICTSDHVLVGRLWY